MPTSTSTGRAVKDIFNDTGFQVIGQNAKGRACNIVDKLLNQKGQDVINKISGNDWQGVYDSFTELRRLIEIKEEACK